jgi:hypothetical protein
MKSTAAARQLADLLQRVVEQGMFLSPDRAERAALMEEHAELR